MAKKNTAPSRLEKRKNDAERFFVKRMAMGKKDQDEDIFLGLRKAYVLPTQKGLYYFITLAIMFVWSVNYSLSLGYAMTFFVGVLGLLTAVLVVNNLTSIRLRPTAQHDFFAGGEAYFRVSVHNQKKEPAIRLMARRNGVFSKPLTLSHAQHGIIEIALDDNARGRKSLDYFRLSTDYPMGVFRSWLWLKMELSLLIYPMPSGDLALPFLPQNQGVDSRETNRNGSEDFNGMRAYQAGDGIRHIVWRKLSQGQVHVKFFQDMAGQRCILRFNAKSLARMGTEAKLSQLCQWVLTAEKQGVRYALHLPDKRIDFGSGVAHQKKCLEALACY